jgi:WD40 repeat protein
MVVSTAVRASLIGVSFVTLPLQNIAQPSLGEFAGSADVGTPRIRGAAAYNPVSQEYALTAGGTNMWGSRDEFHFAWQRVSGDFILQARAELLGNGVDPHRKAGLMVRSSMEAEAAYVDAVVHGDGLTSLQFRRTTGGPTDERPSPVKSADVLQLERRGSTYILSATRFGQPFVTTEIGAIELGADVFVGLVLCSHNADVRERARFSNVRIVKPAPDGFTPYRDYLGSLLEILDVDTGRRQVVHRSDEPFEAPNWTTDGRALIYNTSGRGEGRGRLVRFDLETRERSPIDTGPDIRNNNDHVLSFDGTMLGISGAASGQSAVYTVPIGGGVPKRITPLTPSYLHGWSPDGKMLVYTAARNKEYDIYAIASDGSGEEIRLTTSTGLDDGPEYSPDGKFIYFNSVRSGTMQVWRMKPDGRDAEQLTDDEWNNWFPHVSPDGQWVVFLSFPKEVAPSDHPYYKRVLLRLMPADGGAPRVIAYVYGGQGTINVPSWSPDGRLIAFVSNSGPAR